MRSNCFFWSWALYWRRRKKGREGYIMLRRSRSGPFPHALYAEVRRCGTLRIVSYKPLAPVERKLPPALFPGGPKFGDGDWGDTVAIPPRDR
jgi:hypothetical protein